MSALVPMSIPPESRARGTARNPPMAAGTPRIEFWKKFLKAAETEPRIVPSIQGASGLSHLTIAVGVDDRRARAVIVSGESDARAALLVQADIQATMVEAVSGAALPSV